MQMVLNYVILLTNCLQTVVSLIFTDYLLEYLLEQYSNEAYLIWSGIEIGMVN